MVKKKAIKKKKAVKKENSKKVIKSEFEIIRTEDKKTENKFDEERIDSDFYGEAELARFMSPSVKTPVLESISKFPQQQGFKLGKWDEETPAGTEGEEEANPAKYSLPKTGVTYVESRQEGMNPVQVDLTKLGREERSFGQQTAFSQSPEARIENSPAVERYETAERFDRDKMKKRIGNEEENRRKIRYDAKFSGR